MGEGGDGDVRGTPSITDDVSLTEIETEGCVGIDSCVHTCYWDG